MRVRTLACALAAPFLISATQPVRLQPSGPWVLDYAENSCRLIRNFGEGDTKVKLLFESSGPHALSILAVGRPLAAGMNDVPAKFLPVQGKPFKGSSAQSVNSKEPAILWTSVRLLPDAIVARLEAEDAVKPKNRVRPPPLDLDDEAAQLAAHQAFVSAVTALEIDARRSQPVILETGSLGNALKLFDHCLRDSLRAWGVDPDLEDKIVRPVWTVDPAQWFRADDYPKSMWTTGKESVVSVRLLVDASGRVTKCTSLSSFNEPESNKVACDRFMKNARFEPAELADGTKVPSYYINNVVFRMAD
jgi:hypothetical protein